MRGHPINDHGMISQNGVISFPCKTTCDRKTPVMWGHFPLVIEVLVKTDSTVPMLQALFIGIALNDHAIT